MAKPNIGRHSGTVTNPLTFAQAYEQILAHPTAKYKTTGNQTAFTAQAAKAIKGKHKGEKRIKFLPHGEYAYECCWGYETNCYGQYIDCYTAAI